MPNAERYARYRADQTTIWVSKTAAQFLSRERQSPGEGTAAVIDRLIAELRKTRRGSGGASAPAAPAKAAKKAPATKGAAKSATRGAAQKKTAAKKSATKARRTA